jgi:hypothetical protein
MKKIIPDEGTGIAPLGWYEHNGQIWRAYEITSGGEKIEIHLLDLFLFAPRDGERGTPYAGEPR